MSRATSLGLELKKAQLVRGVVILGFGLVFLMLASLPAAAGPPAPGTLRLTLVDETSQRPTPARVELLDAQGQGYVAEDALPINGDCVDRVIPADYTLERAIAVMSKQFVNPYTKTVQFYSVGKSVMTLPPGDYRLKLRKGPEYRL